MVDAARSEFEISIFVPNSDVGLREEADDPVVHHAIRDLMPSLSRVTKVGAEQLEEQWARTIDTLMKFSSAAAGRSTEWCIQEIEIGMTLSAKGELLFIAEAGAEASIKLKLTRKGNLVPEASVSSPLSSQQRV